MHAYCSQMMELHESHDDENEADNKGAQADEIARELITYAHLPLKIRIRACKQTLFGKNLPNTIKVRPNMLTPKF